MGSDSPFVQSSATRLTKVNTVIPTNASFPIPAKTVTVPTPEYAALAYGPTQPLPTPINPVKLKSVLEGYDQQY